MFQGVRRMKHGASGLATDQSPIFKVLRERSSGLAQGTSWMSHVLSALNFERRCLSQLRIMLSLLLIFTSSIIPTGERAEPADSVLAPGAVQKSPTTVVAPGQNSGSSVQLTRWLYRISSCNNRWCNRASS